MVKLSKIKNIYRELPIQAKASFWFLISMIFSSALAALATPFFTRMMSTSEYGKYNVFTSWQAIINCIVSLNIYGGVYAQGIVKQPNATRSHFISSFQGLLTFLVAIWFVVYCFVSRGIESLLGITFIEGVFMFILIWGTGVFQIWAQAERTEYKYRKLVAASMLYALASTIGGLILVHNMENRVVGRILGMVLPVIFIYSVIFVSQVKKNKQLYNKEIWMHTIVLAIPLVPHYLSQIVLSSSDRIMISMLIDEDSAGIYSLAYTLAQLMTLFNGALLSTIEPWLYKNIRAAELENKINIKNIAYISFSLIAVLNFLLIACAPDIVKIFAPIEYYDAIWVIPPVSMSVFFMFIYSFFALFEFYYEKSKYTAIATVTGAVLNVILNFIFIKLFGYIAAGYTTLVCYIIYSLMHYLFMRKIVREKLNNMKVYDMKVVLGITIVFLILSFMMMGAYNNPLIRYLLLFGIAMIAVIKRRFLVGQINSILQLKKQGGNTIENH